MSKELTIKLIDWLVLPMVAKQIVRKKIVDAGKNSDASLSYHELLRFVPFQERNKINSLAAGIARCYFVFFIGGIALLILLIGWNVSPIIWWFFGLMGLYVLLLIWTKWDDYVKFRKELGNIIDNIEFSQDDALEIARIRFVSGEITSEEYENIKRKLFE